MVQGADGADKEGWRGCGGRGYGNRATLVSLALSGTGTRTSNTYKCRGTHTNRCLSFMRVCAHAHGYTRPHPSHLMQGCTAALPRMILGRFSSLLPSEGGHAPPAHGLVVLLVVHSQGNAVSSYLPMAPMKLCVASVTLSTLAVSSLPHSCTPAVLPASTGWELFHSKPSLAPRLVGGSAVREGAQLQGCTHLVSAYTVMHPVPCS